MKALCVLIHMHIHMPGLDNVTMFLLLCYAVHTLHSSVDICFKDVACKEATFHSLLAHTCNMYSKHSS